MGLLVGFVVLAGILALWYLWLNREIVSEIEIQNPGGEMGAALVIYHPGREGSFRNRVIAGFVEGLVSNGWRVEIARASAQAPNNLSGYDLLVLGSPTY